MPKIINDTGKPIIVNGRDVPEGAFYDAPDEILEVATEEELNESKSPLVPTDPVDLAAPNGSVDPVEPAAPFVIPAEKDITISKIKEYLDHWKVEYTAEETKDKATLYAFFVQEANKRGDGGTN